MSIFEIIGALSSLLIVGVILFVAYFIVAEQLEKRRLKKNERRRNPRVTFSRLVERANLTQDSFTDPKLKEMWDITLQQ